MEFNPNKFGQPHDIEKSTSDSTENQTPGNNSPQTQPPNESIKNTINKTKENREHLSQELNRRNSNLPGRSQGIHDRRIQTGSSSEGEKAAQKIYKTRESESKTIKESAIKIVNDVEGFIDYISLLEPEEKVNQLENITQKIREAEVEGSDIWSTLLKASALTLESGNIEVYKNTLEKMSEAESRDKIKNVAPWIYAFQTLIDLCKNDALAKSQRQAIFRELGMGLSFLKNIDTDFLRTFLQQIQQLDPDMRAEPLAALVECVKCARIQPSEYRSLINEFAGQNVLLNQFAVNLKSSTITDFNVIHDLLNSIGNLDAEKQVVVLSGIVGSMGKSGIKDLGQWKEVLHFISSHHLENHRSEVLKALRSCLDGLNIYSKDIFSKEDVLPGDVISALIESTSKQKIAESNTHWTEEEIQQLRQLIADQRDLLMRKKEGLERWNQEDQENFQKYFGYVDGSELEKLRTEIRQRIDKMLFLNENFSECDIYRCAVDKKGEAAYVHEYEYGEKIFLRPCFWKLPDYGHVGKAQILSHEMSHLSRCGGTLDQIEGLSFDIYGPEHCKYVMNAVNATGKNHLLLKHADTFAIYVIDAHSKFSISDMDYCCGLPDIWPDDAEQIIRSTLNRTKELLQKKLLNLEEWNEAAQMDFQRAFGKFGAVVEENSDDDSENEVPLNMEGARARMISVIQETIRLIESNELNFVKAGAGDAYWFAYMDEDKKTIFLGPQFWNAPDTGIKSKAGILAREIAKFHEDIFELEGLPYNELITCMTLLEEPQGAIVNPANFQYYLEDVFPK